MDRKRVGLAISGLLLALIVLALAVKGALSEPAIKVKVEPGPQARTEDEPERLPGR